MKKLPRFDINKKNEYIDQMCLYKKPYESRCALINVIDITDTEVIYTDLGNNERHKSIDFFKDMIFYIAPHYEIDKNGNRIYIDTLKEYRK